MSRSYSISDGHVPWTGSDGQANNYGRFDTTLSSSISWRDSRWWLWSWLGSGPGIWDGWKTRYSDSEDEDKYEELTYNIEYLFKVKPVTLETSPGARHTSYGSQHRLLHDMEMNITVTLPTRLLLFWWGYLIGRKRAIVVALLLGMRWSGSMSTFAKNSLTESRSDLGTRLSL